MKVRGNNCMYVYDSLCYDMCVNKSGNRNKKALLEAAAGFRLDLPSSRF